jgi:hypothetical protein
MTRRGPQPRDPIEAAIEAALQPGRFVAYRADWDFVSNLEEVAGQIEKLVGTDPERAAGLYETFLAGCYEKAEELARTNLLAIRRKRDAEDQVLLR